MMQALRCWIWRWCLLSLPFWFVLQLPVLAGGKSQTKISVCASNVRQIALACQLYANDYSSQLPCPLRVGGVGMGFAGECRQRTADVRRGHQYFLLSWHRSAIYRPGQLDCVRNIQSLEFRGFLGFPRRRLCFGVFGNDQRAELHQSKHHHPAGNNQGWLRSGGGSCRFGASARGRCHHQLRRNRAGLCAS